jgi:membrane associated rhomboid family serine protease
MPRLGASPFSFPDFRGATRRLILINLCAYFGLALLQFALPAEGGSLAALLAFQPSVFLHGALWQPLTYSFIHFGIIATLFELLSLWFLAGFLENLHTPAWVTGLYAASVLGTALAALALYAVGSSLRIVTVELPLYGCIGGIFGLLVAIGVLYGEMEFLLFFTIGIKAKYMAAMYALIALAMLFTQERMYAFAQLGGAVAGLLFLRLSPRRGMQISFSEQWYGLRNRYYRWKRRRAARKFEVYMRSQGSTSRFDAKGRPMDDDPDDRSRWN